MHIAEATLFVGKKRVAFTSGILFDMGDLKNVGVGRVNFDARFGKALCEYSFAFYKIETEIIPLNTFSAFC